MRFINVFNIRWMEWVFKDLGWKLGFLLVVRVLVMGFFWDLMWSVVFYAALFTCFAIRVALTITFNCFYVFSIAIFITRLMLFICTLIMPFIKLFHQFS